MEDNLMTFKSLEKCYKHVFEKAGWVVLAASKGHKMKVVEYHHSITHLLNSLNNKLENVDDSDKAQDLQIMIDNAEFLLIFVNNTILNAVADTIQEKQEASQSFSRQMSLNQELTNQDDMNQISMSPCALKQILLNQDNPNQGSFNQGNRNQNFFNQ